MSNLNQNESLDVSAKTLDEAIESGLQQLGLTRDQVEIEVINEGKRGLFGLGSEEAKVRLTPKASLTEEPSAQAQPPAEAARPAPVEPEEEAVEAEAPQPVEPETAEAEEPVEPDEEETAEAELDQQEEEVLDLAVDFLDGLLERMGIRADITTRVAPDLVEPDEEPPLVLDVTGNDLGILIGRRNQTLQALQYMVRLKVSKEMKSWQPVVVDVESYRARRRRSLQQMAKRMAERAVADKQQVVLEAMTPYERRIVHIALRDHPEVYTKSVGRDSSRKVTIIPKS
jgi:spoIIIJ-associated protein